MPGDYVFTVVIDWLSDPTVVGTQWSLPLAPVNDTLVHDYKVGIGGHWSPFHVQVCSKRVRCWRQTATRSSLYNIIGVYLFL